MMTAFDSTYEGVPAIRISSVKEHELLCESLSEAGYSYRTKIIPPRGRTHRRPKGWPREIVVMLLGAGVSDGA